MAEKKQMLAFYLLVSVNFSILVCSIGIFFLLFHLNLYTLFIMYIAFFMIENSFHKKNLNSLFIKGQSVRLVNEILFYIMIISHLPEKEKNDLKKKNHLDNMIMKTNKQI